MKDMDSSGPYEYEARLVSVIRRHLRELPRCHVCQRLAESTSPEPASVYGEDFTCGTHKHPGTTGEGPFPLYHAETVRLLLKLVSPTKEDVRQAKAVLLNDLCRQEWLRGVGEGQDVDGILRLEVRVSEVTEEIEGLVPASIDGIEVHMEAVGDIVAQGLPPVIQTDYPGTD